MTSTRLASRPGQRLGRRAPPRAAGGARLRLGRGPEAAPPAARSRHRGESRVASTALPRNPESAGEQKRAGRRACPATRWSPVPGHRGDSKHRAWVRRSHAREVARPPRPELGGGGGVNTIFRNGSPNATAATQVAQLQVGRRSSSPLGVLFAALAVAAGRRRDLGRSASTTRRPPLSSLQLVQKGRTSAIYGGGRQPDRLHPLQQTSASRSPRSSSRRTSRTPRWRSRTTASSTTARIDPESDRPRRGEEHRGRENRGGEPRRSRSSWSAISTSRTPNRRSGES